MKHLIFLVSACLIILNLSAQISTEPQLPVAGEKVTITFDSSKENRLGYYTGDLYAHTGVTIEGKGQWQNVIGDWGENDKQPQLTHKGNGIYELEIAPDINSFYSVASGEKVTELCFVFRYADKSKQTDNLFVKVYDEGLNIELTSPANNTILTVSENINISANASQEASLKLFVGETLLNETTGTTISAQHSIVETGEYWLIAEATADETVRDSVKVIVRPEVSEQTKPAAYKKGINYISDNSAALVLWAPEKEFIYALGDFNNWEVSGDYLMKKDGNYFWLDIVGLEAGKEYAFQYLIDGQLRIADPYTEKILDPWNDKYIEPTTYPNLKAYPEGKTEGIVSVLQTAQEAYNWQVTDFQMPEKDKMVIYEMLIRDFTAEHTYASITENLDYLEDLRINVLELMPVNEFDGNSSWGYNPTFYFAPDKYYGPKNELKQLIDECHKRGIAVVIDMVLNHSWGQSPFAMMYWNESQSRPAANNPWYNEVSPNQSLSWGSDFNHEAHVTQELVDSVNAFWINEYKVDGFRFDFTKGFTQTPGDGWAKDPSRISILKRMADEIWQHNPDALVILEHFADNAEEKELADYGMFLWGNMNHNYGEAAMAYTDNSNSNLSWGIYSERGWVKPNLVTYMESHDEERLTYKCVNFGNSKGSYSTKDLSTALDRMELNSVFFLPLPGPKMIWQFGELGYDYSINSCEDGTTINDGCRTSPKPIRWDYTENTDRTDLFHVVAKLNELKQSYKEFTPENAGYSLRSETKWYKLSSGGQHVIGLGNFDMQENDIDITFPATGKYYEFFSGDSIVIDVANQNFDLTAGEYRLYSTRKFDEPKVITDINTPESTKTEVKIYPNPATDILNITVKNKIVDIRIYSTKGQLIYNERSLNRQEAQVSTADFTPGIYYVQIIQKNQTLSQKVMVK